MFITPFILVAAQLLAASAAPLAVRNPIQAPSAASASVSSAATSVTLDGESAATATGAATSVTLATTTTDTRASTSVTISGTATATSTSTSVTVSSTATPTRAVTTVTLGRSTTATRAATSTTTTTAGRATETGAAAPGEIIGTFGAVIDLLGDDQKTDILFPKGTTGAFEVEFQDRNGNRIQVTENREVAANSVPLGFTFLEPRSYKVVLERRSAAITLQKIDFIFDAESVRGVDVSKAVIGKFCSDAKAFVVSEALGELEFEVEENEVTLTVSDLNGEWGIFIPVADAGAGQVAKEENDPKGELKDEKEEAKDELEDKKEEAKDKVEDEKKEAKDELEDKEVKDEKKKPKGELKDKKKEPKGDLKDEKKEAADKLEDKKKEAADKLEDEKEAEGELKNEEKEPNAADDELKVKGEFDRTIETAANRKTVILFTEAHTGAFEVEIQSADSNTITVKKNDKRPAPPAGFVFVDPSTFQVTAAKAPRANDVLKIDYFFSDAVIAAADVTKGVIGKLDPATNTIITDLDVLKAKFEVELEEKEWNLTVPDLNGEWAILIPISAVKQP